jgi:uncharacterized protein YkwD
MLTMLLLAGLFGLSPLQPVSAGPRVRPLFGAPRQDSPTETPTSASAPTPADIINAVNALRLSHGLNALAVHPVLTQVAVEQANALADSEGAVGHERPNGMTLGQQLLMLGYPLSGDLSMDGYRSENWVAASTTEDAISFWLSDDEHTNTMLSPNRSDMGAAVAVSDQIYVVIETALQTSSGQMQSDAYPILTGIPMTQNAYSSMLTESAKYGLLPQDSVPVIRSTALPNGDVIHEVRYGQALWSIAIQYDTTMQEIRQLNHLQSDTLQPGQKLIVRKNATQPAPGAKPPPTAEAIQNLFAVTPVYLSPTLSPQADPAGTSANDFLQQNSLVIVALIISFSVLMAGLGVFGKRKRG